MRHNIACCIQWKEQWNPRALGELPGQRLFCISTVKAQLNKTAVFLGSQDTGWPWTVALTLWDVYVHLLGFTILSVTLEASFQPAKVDFWSIPTTFLSAISQMNSPTVASTECLKLVEVQICSMAQGGEEVCAPGWGVPACQPCHTTTTEPRLSSAHSLRLCGCTWMCETQV